MAYTIYTSQGIVLSRVTIGESAVVTRIYMREFGAVSVRAENGMQSTKFAPSLQVGTIGVYDMVRSRSGYKLTGIRPVSTIQAKAYSEKSIQFVRQCCVYVSRFVPSDEGPEEELYILLSSAIAFASHNEWNKHWWNSFRLRTMQVLGYVPFDFQPSDQRALEELLQNVEISSHL